MTGRVFLAFLIVALSVWLPAEASKNSSAAVGSLEATISPQEKSPSDQRSWRIVGEVRLPDIAAKTAADWSITIPLVIAILGIGGAYWNGTRLETRKARIAFINEQLKGLYGPLFSLNNATRAAWDSFRSEYRPTGPFFSDIHPPNERELREWMIWMKTVFQPMNEKMSRVIVENAHLIDGEMPKSFLDFISHVEGYRVVIQKWENGDQTRYNSILRFPDEFGRDVTDAFARVRARQIALLR